MIARTINAVLERWNGLGADAAAAEILPCCGSRAWSRGMERRRPLDDETELLAASDATWRELAEVDWMEAFASHPRIGERHAEGEASERSLAWSAGEQSAALLGEADAGRRLAEGNRAYEAKFGRTFIVFANGRSASEILKILEERMGNEPEAEVREAAEQQRQITRLRLQRWIGVV